MSNNLCKLGLGLILSPFILLSSNAIAAAKPTASVSWSPSTVESGQSSTLTWNSSNATSCNMNGATRGTSGSWVGTNRTRTQTTTLYCTGPGGTSSTVRATLTVKQPTPPPTASISWSPSTVSYGKSSTLNWSSTNATSCKMNGANRSTSGSWVGTNRTRTQTTSLYCTGPGGTSTTVSSTLTVLPPPPKPTVSLRWSSPTINYGGESTLIWNSTNATSCVMSGSPRSTSGDWLATNRTRSQTTTFYCTGPGGTSNTVSATLTVLPPPKPTAHVSWDPATVDRNEDSTLTWSSTNATSCVMNGATRSTSGNWIGKNRTVTQTTSLYCTGPGGTSETVTSTLTVIQPPPPQINIQWVPSTIMEGDQVILQWNSEYSTSCLLDDGADRKNVDEGLVGQISYSNVEENRTAVLNCSGLAGETAQESVSLTVIPKITLPSLSVSYSDGKLVGSSTDANSTNPVDISVWFSKTPYNNSNKVHAGVVPATNGNFEFAIPAQYLDGTYDVRVFAMDIDKNGERTDEFNYQLLTVPNALPQVSASFDQQEITLGDTVTLDWTSVNTQSCEVEGEGSNASLTFTPTELGSFTKTVVCQGVGNLSASSSTTVEVGLGPVPVLHANMGDYTISGKVSDPDSSASKEVNLWFSPIPFNINNAVLADTLHTSSSYQYVIPQQYRNGSYDLMVEALDIDKSGNKTGQSNSLIINIDEPGEAVRALRETFRQACEFGRTEPIVGYHEFTSAHALGQYTGCKSFDASLLRLFYPTSAAPNFTVLTISAPEANSVLRLPNINYQSSRFADNSVAIHLTDMIDTTVEVSFIQNFKTGVLIENAHNNNFEIRTLDNNQVNLKLINSDDNTFFGGSYTHWSKDPLLWGYNALELESANKNQWIGTNMENSTGIMPIQVTGDDNIFFNVRWENVNSVGFNGSKNLIFFGQHGVKLNIGPKFWTVPAEDRACAIDKLHFAQGVYPDSGSDKSWSKDAVYTLFNKLYWSERGYIPNNCPQVEAYWHEDNEYNPNSSN